MKKISLVLIVTMLFFINSDIMNKIVYDSNAQIAASEDIVSEEVMEITDNTVYKTPTYQEKEWIEDGMVDYPIDQTEAEWKELESHNEMIEACTVPDEVLSDMETKELLELLYNYPLLIDMYAYDSLEEGVMHLAEQCNILGELCKREDFSVELLKEQREHKSVSSYEEFKEKNLLDSLVNPDEVVKIKNKSNTMFKGNIIMAQAASSPNLKEIVRVDTITIGNGKTTKGTVYKYAGNTWSSEQNAEYRKTYPLATLVSGADNRYNCHSYAWYKQSTTNKYWIYSPADYINSGMYKNVNNAKTNCKIEYVKNGNMIHSGIVTNTNNLTVESKWGTGPLMIHKAGYCPYTSGISYKYYQKK